MSSKVQDCRRRFSPDTKGTMKKETTSHQGMFLHKPSKLEKLSPFSPIPSSDEALVAAI